jgi:carbamate kinase
MTRQFSDEELFVITLGGNAVLPQGKSGSIDEQFDLARATMSHVAQLAKVGLRMVLSHGNGPIVGNIVIRNECASHLVTPMPLFVCGADSQGGIGFMIQNALRNELYLAGFPTPVATVVTQVEVDIEDPAFDNPSKPIGPFYREDEARSMEKTQDWSMREDSGRGWRRVVPSPEPKRIVEWEAIKLLVDNDVLTICAGGGGIPVKMSPEGLLKGVDAVVDKDLAATLLARSLEATSLVFVTSVPRVAIRFGKSDQRDIVKMDLAELIRHQAAGEFPPGSMGPKMEASRRFLEEGGREVIICAPEELGAAIEGQAGTHIYA